MSNSGSIGICQLCGVHKGKRAMVTHLQACLPSSSKAGPEAGGKPLLLLCAQAYNMYWLDLAVKPEAKLKDLDRFLRDIWLECCGHMSEFQGAARREVNMNTKIGNAFKDTQRLDYVYDFGTSTQLEIVHKGAVVGGSKGPVLLLARNEPFAWKCDECGESAVAICCECIYEERGLCCEEHAVNHECGEDMLLPVVNSPRMGICGYTG